MIEHLNLRLIQNVKINIIYFQLLRAGNRKHNIVNALNKFRVFETLFSKFFIYTNVQSFENTIRVPVPDH